MSSPPPPFAAVTAPACAARSTQGSYRAYRARKRFLELREKSMGIFHGKKRRRGSWVFYFLGDYVGAGDGHGALA